MVFFMVEIFSKVKKFFSQAHENISNKLIDWNILKRNFDLSSIESLEESLILADVNIHLVEKIIKNIKYKIKDDNIQEAFLNEVYAILNGANGDLLLKKMTPIHVILVVGVNGNGKTTTVAKLASFYKKSGYSVRIVAADTFRAAAIEQLQFWSKQVGVDFSSKAESDPASVVFDGYADAVESGNDVLIIDTSGRLHNKEDLMNELVKIKNVIKKAYLKFQKTDLDLKKIGEIFLEKNEDLKNKNEKLNEKLNGKVSGKLDKNLDEILIDEKIDTVFILDAFTGQTANLQSQIFLEKLNINHIIITKLDCTAKAGTILSIFDTYKIPISAVCFGEKIDDISQFFYEDFIKGLL